MRKTTSLCFIGLLLILATPGYAQYTDSLSISNSRDSISSVIRWNTPSQKRIFPYKSFIVPAVMVVYGITSLNNNGLQGVNRKVKEELYTERSDKKQIHIDNYLQYSPGV